jgi:hypothetical protein
MTKFRIVPEIIGARKMFTVERRRWAVLPYWRFEAFAKDYDEARKIVEHLGGPIVEMYTRPGAKQ